MDSKVRSENEEDSDTEFASLPLMQVFYVHPRGNENDWRVTEATVATEYQGDLSTNASSEDLYSEYSSQYTDIFRSLRSSYTSLDSQDSVAQSVASTPQSSPASTPVTVRRTSLKLNVADSTWKRIRDKKSSRRKRIKQQLHSQSTKVIKAVKQKKTHLRTKLVLLFLFGCILGLVFYTRDMYLKRRQEIIIGEKIKFNEISRKLNLLNDDGASRIEGDLGINLPSNIDPYQCGKSHIRFSTGVCIEWKYRARLMIRHIKHQNISCYNIAWESIHPETVLKDCIDMSGSHWYGIWEPKSLSWPLKGSIHQSKPLVTGDPAKGGFGSVIERYWLSSNGIAIRAEPKDPLYVSINSTGNERLCLEAKYAGFPYYALKNELPELRYNICTGPSIQMVHESMMHLFHSLPNGTSSSVSEFVENIVWKPLSPNFSESINQTYLKEYAHNISSFWADGGFMIIDSRWQAREGDMEFNVTEFPNPDEIFTILHRKKFKYLLTVHPYSCLDSLSFNYLAYDKCFVSDMHDKLPLLTQWQGKICAILDLTRNVTLNWFLTRIEKLKETLKVDGFVFVGGLSSSQPRRYKFFHYVTNPDYFIQNYLNAASQVVPIMGSYIGFETQKIPSFISLPPRTSSWDSVNGLKSVIKAVLTLNLLGYPLLNPGSIGGELPTYGTGHSSVIDKELYLRWMQLAVFLPVTQFTILPVSYDPELRRAADNLLEIRRAIVIPALRRALEKYFSTGAPVIRPLWWIAPDDYNTQSIDSEFLIGSDILVAPVLEPGKIGRDIYVPRGWWKDELNGNMMIGGKWMYNYIVGESGPAYFTRKSK